MIVVTSEKIVGKDIKSTIGYVKGSSARARHAVADVFASLKILLVVKLKNTLGYCNKPGTKQLRE